jgi:hypothetical protein
MIIIKPKTIAIIVFIILASYLSGYLTADTIKTFNGLFMPIHQGSDLHYLRIEGSAIVGDDERVRLGDDEFAKAIKETNGKKIHQIKARGGILTHHCLDELRGQYDLKSLDLSNNRMITDVACKKIVEFFPRLETLNLFNTAITDKGLVDLLDLTSLKRLHVGQSQVTWKAANVFRAKMQSISGNDDLEITTGYNEQALPSFKLSKRLRETYQTNVLSGKLNPNYKVEVLGEKVEGNKKYDE